MSVNPGFGGQKFIEHTYSKIKELRAMAAGVNDALQIEIDGGVSLANAGKLLQAGADVLVAGSFVFSSETPIETIQALKAVDPSLQQA
jgi:ribulose-phosphate 3-epimerase